MKKISIILFVFAGIICLLSCGEGGSTEKHPKLSLEDIRQEFIACKSEATEKHTCKEFVAKAINGNFEISDFNVPEKQGEYVDYDKIAAIVETSADWKKVGEATEQGAMDYVQKCANEGKPAIAISTKSGAGNIAIIVKGEQVKSTSWGLNCPTVAIFFPNQPEKSFIGKTLNYAWGKPDGISLYVRE
ncbi:MAG: hypothetical protein JKY42_08745 [Flavobacteriales bacterium]|nr:hypothetical protein [Flavobacteriales bacterium]